MEKARTVAEGGAVPGSVVEKAADTAGVCSSCAPPPPSSPLLPLPTGSIYSSRSTQSSTTVRAKILRAEAEHAQRVAEIELELEKRQAQLARQTADLVHRANLAAIEAEGSVRGSRHSSRSRRTRHSDVLEEQRVSNWLDDVRRETSPALGRPFESAVALGPNLSQNINTSSRVQMAAIQDEAAAAARAAPATAGAETLPAAPLSGDNAAVSSLISSLDRLFNNFNKNNNSSKVSNINLPFFDGKSPVEYLGFKRAFLDTETSYTHTENLARLSYALRGVAREAVSAVLVSARVPADVLRLLDMRFGRAETIVLQEIAAMRSLPRVNAEGKDFVVFACRVRNCVEVIRLLDQTDYLSSPELFNAMLSKLPPLLRPRWQDYAVSHEGYGAKRLVLFADFLAREVDLQVKYGMHEAPASTFNQAVDTNRKFRDYNNYKAVKCNAVSENKNHSISEKTSKIHNKNSIIICLLCDKNHELADCVKFREMPIPDRWQFVKIKKICHRCLKKSLHRIKFCNNKEVCKLDGCSYRHHLLLHDSNLERNLAAHVDVDEAEDSPNEYEAASESDMCVLDVVAHAATDKMNDNVHLSRTSARFSPLLKIVAVTVSGPLGSYDTYALLDDGATSTFIDAETSSRIGVSGPKAQIHLDCVGGLSKDTPVEYVDFHIRGRHGSNTYLVRRARSIKNLGIKCQSVCRNDIVKLDHLSDLVDVICYCDAKPTIIIGIDNWHLTLTKAIRKGTKSQPVAIDTNLGWVLFGFSSNRTNPVEFVNHIGDFQADRDSSLESLIKEQYQLEALGVSKQQVRNAADEHALKILNDTTHRLPTGRFEVGLLWRPDVSEVPNSYPLALSRFLSLERKMAIDESYARSYSENVHAMIQKGYAEECQGPPVGTTWYLPHFGVTNPNKPGKLRIVHDAAAKVRNVSLNSLLLPGPDLLRSLLGILFRFREREVAMSADIREMFPQVKIRVEDRDAQRFLWRDNTKEPIKIYRMSSMMFGAASSPCSALFVKNKNAEDWRHLYPEAAAAITDDHYMDDFIGSVASIETAAQLAADVVSVHKRAGFEMRGWVSNQPEALAKLPNDLLLSPAVGSVQLGDFPSAVRTLGLIWQPAPDTITFSSVLDKPVLSKKFTKRVILSYVMRVYDPLGMLAPIVVSGRIMFQNIWRKGYEWDEELPENECDAWNFWFQDLASVSKLEVPRFYHKGSQFNECELHVFSDASELAFVAVAYWRFIDDKGNVKVTLICSKARVAPLKPISIPRLELQGALLAARLASSICEAHRYVPSKRFFWCDSLNVLGWLRSDGRSYKPFVANRIGEICELTEISEWRWVPTDLNVADDATRIKRGELSSDSRWFCGPQFLLSSEWPLEPMNTKEAPALLELKPVARSYVSSHIHHTTSYNHNPSHVFIYPINESQLHLPLCANSSRFSSWLRLVRATARAHQYITLLRLRCLRKRGVAVNALQLAKGNLLTFVPNDVGTPCTNAHNSRSLTADNIHLAEVHIFRQSQIESFKNEFLSLRAGRPVQTPSRLSKFVVFFGQDDLIRLSDRTAAVADVEKVKNPIILDGKHPAIRLLILSYHVKAAHCNTEMVVNQLRQKFWVIRARSVVRSIMHYCPRCRLLRATPLQPPVGDLPLERLSHHRRPFSFVGLDYFGPLLVTVGRRREKRWVAVLTCLVTRAIHLEVVHSLTTDAALMCLRRFIARRGTPCQIISDNGTAFVGANRQMRALYGETITDFAANQTINWKFLPPSAPFMGGAWERMVRSVKTALRAILREQAPADEVLQTLLAEAEFVVNSRPLTHVSTESEAEEALTPLHFLLGSSSGGQSFPAVELQDRDLVSRASWRRALRLADHFWRRWLTEYLPTLAPRRNQRATQNIAVGDLVLVVDGNLPRGSWPRGRVTAVYPGRDGVVRVADICTSAGVLRRPAKKLVLL